jgi:plasmid maintenance system antidote protein VapI
MSVTKAAALVGVGRPALSNLLNGNSALSMEMATRLAKAFNVPREDLLQMQVHFDAAQARTMNAPANIKAHVPPFLGIRANQIEGWVEHNIPARARLAVLLRTLIHSSGSALSKVDFPGNDDAERPGWDGVVEAREGTPWVPLGRSGWEFGTNEDAGTKASADITKSEKALSRKERLETTFVFVTPRRWPGKEAWLAKKKARNTWKDVLAYDASDLEQWFEQSIPAQVWFANETQIAAQNVRSLDKCWTEWAAVAAPPLSGALFDPAVEAARRTIFSRLSSPPDGPILIAADSTEEALAFLSQLFGGRDNDELLAFRDRVLVFDKPGILPRLAEGVKSFIAVAYTRDVERELGPHAKSMHSIVVYPRNVANTTPDIVLEPVSDEAFTKALEAMGKNRDEIARLENESGRSLTVLRRRLATVPAVRTPAWAADHSTGTSLIPFLFVGAWHIDNETDTQALSLLAERSYAEVEQACQRLAQLDDAPMWSVGAYRGVISKIDLLHSVGRFITQQDLNRYFQLARQVLGEDNPALDLKEEQRWAAAIFGKARQFSSAFREGISETLVLLAVHGRHLFDDRLGTDTEAEVARVVRELLPTPLTTRVLEANDHDLPTYGEAAPGEFLSILERDLKTDMPAIYGLLRPATSGIFAHPSRTGLLWALEGLSWNPATLTRAALILAQLAQIEIKDNWANTPMNSLTAIFRAWMPQTAASHTQRVTLLKKLAQQVPATAWKICIGQLSSQGGFSTGSHKPRWRSDGYGFGQPLTPTGPKEFMLELLELVLHWNPQTLNTLSDLVKLLHRLDEGHQARVWKLVEEWAKETASDTDKAAMREQVRVSTLSRRAAMRTKNNASAAALVARATVAYSALKPSDIVNQHSWLFLNPWIEESADDTEDIAEFDHQKRGQRIQKMRVEAMREMRDVRGVPGLLALAQCGKASSHVGFLAAQCLLDVTELQQLISLAFQVVLEDTDVAYACKELVAGALRGISDEQRESVLKRAGTGLLEEDTARLLVLAPFVRSTWLLVDTLGAAGQARYWAEVVPESPLDTQTNECVERLLKAARPRAAFSCVHYHPDKLDPHVLYRLLQEIAKGGNERPGDYLLDEYSVEQAFKHLNGSRALTLEQKAGLEFAFLDLLASAHDGGPAIPNLERYIETHPEVFVQAVATVFRRADGVPDPEELGGPAQNQKAIAERWYTLLSHLERVPGHDDLGVLNVHLLTRWVEAVRQSCSDLGRADAADRCLGELLAHAQVGVDGVWPCEVVRQVMEFVQSEQMMRGAHTGVYNSRGIQARGEGGDQERELADRYREWGVALQVSHPYVSSNLLMRLARTYEREERREETRAGIRRRLPGFR